MFSFFRPTVGFCDICGASLQRGDSLELHVAYHAETALLLTDLATVLAALLPAVPQADRTRVASIMDRITARPVRRQGDTQGPISRTNATIRDSVPQNGTVVA